MFVVFFGQNLFAFLIPSKRAPQSAYHMLLDLINLITFCEEYKL
jgi:hypothetical protein